MKSARKTFTCPVCQTHVLVDIIEQIDLLKDGEAVVAIRDGVLNRVRCLTCGHKRVAVTPVLLRESEQKWLAAYLPLRPPRNRFGRVVEQVQESFDALTSQGWRCQLLIGPNALSDAWPDAAPKHQRLHNFLTPPPVQVRRRLLNKAARRTGDDPDETVEIGIGLYEAGDFERAIRVLNKIASTDSDDTDVLITLGSCHFECDRFDEAAIHYDKAAKRTRDSTTYLVAGVAHYRGGDLVSARQRLQAAVGQTPDMTDAWFYLACVCAAQGHADDATNALGQAAATGFDNPDALASEPPLAALKTGGALKTMIKAMESNREPKTKTSKRGSRGSSNDRTRPEERPKNRSRSGRKGSVRQRRSRS